jgi:hypothetical protein
MTRVRRRHFKLRLWSSSLLVSRFASTATTRSWLHLVVLCNYVYQHAVSLVSEGNRPLPQCNQTAPACSHLRIYV